MDISLEVVNVGQAHHRKSYFHVPVLVSVPWSVGRSASPHKLVELRSARYRGD